MASCAATSCPSSSPGSAPTRRPAQLQSALTSRVVLKQAKGIRAQQGELDLLGAFQVLRRYAGDHNLRLTDVARGVISRQLPSQQLLEHPRTPSPTDLTGPRALTAACTSSPVGRSWP